MHSHTRLVDQTTLCPATKKWEIRVLLIPLSAFPPRMTVEMVCYKKKCFFTRGCNFFFNLFGYKAFVHDT